MDYTYVDREKFNRMLGVCVREQRMRLGLTHADVARTTGISAGRLHRIENGQVSLSNENLDLFKRVLRLEDETLDHMLEIARVAFIDQFLTTVYEAAGDTL